jgi:hypothetical protein
MFDKIKEMKEKKRKAEEKAEQDKRIKEKALVNKSLRELQGQMRKYEQKKETFIKLAREADRSGQTAQYNLAAKGLKMSIDSYSKANAMYLSLTISSQMKDMFTDTKAFVEAMSTISGQLSEIQSEIDISSAESEFAVAMQNISQAEEKLGKFSDGICNTIEDYAANSESDAQIDAVIHALIHSTDTAAEPTENTVEIDRRIRELEGIYNGRR